MAFRKGLVVQLDLITCIMSLDGATETVESLTTVCCGPANAEHLPTKIKQANKCSTCGEVGYGDLKKANLIGTDQYQVVEQQEVATVKDQVLGASKKVLGITIHDAADVTTTMLPGKSTYYLSPDGNAQIGAYSLLYDMISRHPEKAFLTRWTPTSNMSTFQIKAFNGVLAMEQRIDPEAVRAVPTIDVVEPTTDIQAKVDAIVEQETKPFDPALYRNAYAEALTNLLASKQAVQGEQVATSKAASKTPASAGAVDLTAQLNAMLGLTA